MLQIVGIQDPREYKTLLSSYLTLLGASARSHHFSGFIQVPSAIVEPIVRRKQKPQSCSWREESAAAFREIDACARLARIERAITAIEKRYSEWRKVPGSQRELNAIRQTIQALSELLLEDRNLQVISTRSRWPSARDFHRKIPTNVTHVLNIHRRNIRSWLRPTRPGTRISPVL